MRPLLFTIAMLFCLPQLPAQIGVNGGIKRMSAPEWEAYFPGDDFLNTGFKAGIDYWFRLKNKRVEFTPELSFSQFKSDIVHFTDDTPQRFKLQQTGFHFNANIYPLDFGSDCDCPTFDKDGGILDKGLFLQVSPGLSWMKISYENPQSTTHSTAIVPSIGVGVGLDVGITNFFTITPLLNYHYYFNASWKDLAQYANDGRTPSEQASEESSLRQFFAGLKMSFRFDELNKFGYR